MIQKDRHEYLVLEDGSVNKIFLTEELINIKIEMTPFYDRRSFHKISDDAPPMPFAIGPWLCYDKGPEIIIDFCEVGNRHSIEIPNELKSLSLELKVDKTRKMFLVTRNNELIKQGTFDELRIASENTTIGNGFSSRYWNGIVKKMEIFYGNSPQNISLSNISFATKNIKKQTYLPPRVTTPKEENENIAKAYNLAMDGIKVKYESLIRENASLLEVDRLKTPSIVDIENSIRKIRVIDNSIDDWLKNRINKFDSIGGTPNSEFSLSHRWYVQRKYALAKQGIFLTENEEKLAGFQNKHLGKRCFVIGNGPSLNDLNLTLLKGEFTFGVNAIYTNYDNMGFYPTYYVVEDQFVAEDRADEINSYKESTKFFGHYLDYCLNNDEKSIILNVILDYRNYKDFPNFSKDARECVWVGGTVSFISIQLAYYMGFSEVYLIGFDHSYEIPEDAIIDGNNIVSVSGDVNHFNKDYFGKGKRWHDPKVDRMEQAYIKSRKVFEADNKIIKNATAGGKLEVFDRIDYNSLFNH